MSNMNKINALFSKRSEKRIAGLILAIISLLIVFILTSKTVYASAPTDEITNYSIVIDVNEDASLNIYYHIDWLVLEDNIGPLEWVKVGIPNSHTKSYEAISNNIRSINTMSSGGYYIRIDFDEKYYKGETVSFDFMIVQDNMYQVNKFTEGQTVYSFTPGWFDDIAVDDLTIKWDMKNAEQWTPDCQMDNGYLVWNSALRAGEKYSISVTYPNDAYGFDLSMDSSSDSISVFTVIGGIIGFIIAMVFTFSPMLIVVGVVLSLIKYRSGASFGGTKKITRTRIEYYPSCPGCGAARKEGEKYCSYCGRSMVKSEEVIKEEDIEPKDKSILKLSKDGEYRYSSSPNTYIRVHSVVIPRTTPSRSSSGGGRSSSCAHSSCAHSSCACACACACAGGGRAGCSFKDFYKTNLRLKSFEKGLKK